MYGWYVWTLMVRSLKYLTRKTLSVPTETTSGTIYSFKMANIAVKQGDMIGVRAKSSDTNNEVMIKGLGSNGVPITNTKIHLTSLDSDGLYDNPAFDSLNLQQFDKTYGAMLVAAKFVSNATSAQFTLDIPSDMNISVISAMKKLSDGSIRPVKALDWVYSNSNKTLTVSFGETVALGEILIGVYAL